MGMRLVCDLLGITCPWLGPMILPHHDRVSRVFECDTFKPYFIILMMHLLIHPLHLHSPISIFLPRGRIGLIRPESQIAHIILSHEPAKEQEGGMKGG